MTQRNGEPSPTDEEKQDPAPAQDAGSAAGEAQTEQQPPVKYSMSPGLSNFLGSNRIGLAISSYQSGKFYLLGQNKDGGLLVDERFFRKAMGICVPDQETLRLATLFQIIKFKNRALCHGGLEVRHHRRAGATAASTAASSSTWQRARSSSAGCPCRIRRASITAGSTC